MASMDVSGGKRECAEMDDTRSDLPNESSLKQTMENQENGGHKQMCSNITDYSNVAQTTSSETNGNVECSNSKEISSVCINENTQLFNGNACSETTKENISAFDEYKGENVANANLINLSDEGLFNSAPEFHESSMVSSEERNKRINSFHENRLCSNSIETDRYAEERDYLENSDDIMKANERSNSLNRSGQSLNIKTVDIDSIFLENASETTDNLNKPRLEEQNISDALEFSEESFHKSAGLSENAAEGTIETAISPQFLDSRNLNDSSDQKAMNSAKYSSDFIDNVLMYSNNFQEERKVNLNETSSTENEALDVLLELDGVLDDCLKDCVNENNDEYRLNIQISLEELEGTNRSGFEGTNKAVKQKSRETEQSNTLSVNDETNIPETQKLVDAQFNNLCANDKTNRIEDQQFEEIDQFRNMCESDDFAELGEYKPIPPRNLETEVTNLQRVKNSREVLERDSTIEECLQDLDDYLRNFDEDAFNSSSPMPLTKFAHFNQQAGNAQRATSSNSKSDNFSLNVQNNHSLHHPNVNNINLNFYNSDSTFANVSSDPHSLNLNPLDMYTFNTNIGSLSSRSHLYKPNVDHFNENWGSADKNEGNHHQKLHISGNNTTGLSNIENDTLNNLTSVVNSRKSSNSSDANYFGSSSNSNYDLSANSYNESANSSMLHPNNASGSSSNVSTGSSYNSSGSSRNLIEHFCGNSSPLLGSSNSAVNSFVGSCDCSTTNSCRSNNSTSGSFNNPTSFTIPSESNPPVPARNSSSFPVPYGVTSNATSDNNHSKSVPCGVNNHSNHCGSFDNLNSASFYKGSSPCGSFNNPVFARDAFKNFTCSVRESNGNDYRRNTLNGMNLMGPAAVHQASNHRYSCSLPRDSTFGSRDANHVFQLNSASDSGDVVYDERSCPVYDVRESVVSGRDYPASQACSTEWCGVPQGVRFGLEDEGGNVQIIQALNFGAPSVHFDQRQRASNPSGSTQLHATGAVPNVSVSVGDFGGNNENSRDNNENGDGSFASDSRPLSSSGARSAGLTRNHAYRATIGAISRPGSSSSNGGGEERSATGSRAPDNVTSRRAESSVVVEDSMATGAVVAAGDAKRPLWLRTSMRRLQPLPLPNNTTENSNNAMDNLTPGEGLPPGRPISAPSRLSSRSRERTAAARARSSSASSRSRRPRSLSSSVSSVVSSVDSTSTPTCTPTPAQQSNPTGEELNNNANNTRRSCERPSRTHEMPDAESPLGQWPHSLSSTLAYIGCTLGIFNISRFAILSVHFGANFIFQFLIVTLLVGLPMFTLQLCLGQQLGAGVIDMWKISPMFQGVGVSLLFFQAMTGIYSIMGVSWMFVYFRDSFVTKFERYRWAEPFIYYRDDIQPPINGSYKLTETVPDYLSGIVFQRHHLVSGSTYGTIKFQPAFNLAVVWMIVFVSLSKGLRSYGKVIYVFTLLPIFGTFVLCAKLLGMMPAEMINNVFPETSWNEFFINPRSWLAACQEVFLTWGMLGAAVMQIASHNKNKKLLQRDSGLIAVITVTILLLAAFLANTCVQILKANGFSYQPDSFEKLSTYTFMRHKSNLLPPNLASTPVKFMVHNSFIVGDRINRPGFDPTTESGYQVLRFATELIPSTFAILGTDQVSPFWTVLFYFILILFGIAQQLAIWHCVITGIMAIKAKVLKSWETTITFFSCACGFILGLPMTTEFGIYVVYFMDLAIGGVWWLILIVLLQIIAVFMVRGRPYSGDALVTVLFHSNNYKCLLSWAPALLSFTWNVVLPVVLMVWCIAFFKNGNFRELFIWHHGPSLEYWPLWARQIGAMLQLLPVLAVPFIAVIQSYRYLNNGPNDILDRIQLLYRPPLGEHMDDLAVQEAAAASAAMNTTTANANTSIVIEDPPPKYTPPPSYTTATGARIAKMLRQSIRRSMRRIANVLGESSRNPPPAAAAAAEPPPPDYNAVLVEMNQSPRRANADVIQRELATIATSSTGLTAADVASILRSSFRRSTIRTLRRDNDQSMSSLSAENLIDSAAPIGETSLVLALNLSDTDNDKDGNNTSSVI